MIMKAQMSVEHLLLVAFALAILVPGIYFFYTYSQTSETSLSGAQYAKLGQEMLSVAGKVRAQGTGSWITLDTNLPTTVTDIRVAGAGTEIVMSYTTGVGDTSAVFFSDVIELSNGTGLDGTIFTTAPHGGRASFRFWVNETGVVHIAEWYG